MRTASRLPFVAGFVATLAIAAVTVAPPVRGDVHWLVQGEAEGIGVDTDSDSAILGQNEGDPVAAGTLRLWVGAEVHPRLQFLLLGELSGASGDGQSADTEQSRAYARVALRADRKLTLDVGRVDSPLGNFSGRYLPSVNPLIGGPTSYGIVYPLGFQLAGSFGMLDFRGGMVDQPLVSERLPVDPDNVFRPSVAVGLTPFTGLRVGAYFTEGPYLNDEIAPTLDPGVRWRDLRQQIVGVDLRFSRGHFEVHGDYVVADYDTPPDGQTRRGRTWFVEPKYTWSPRFFTAARYERVGYVGLVLLPFGWIVVDEPYEMVEVGGGFRVARGTIVKASYRTERWAIPSVWYPDGRAVEVQLTHRFDVLDWVRNWRLSR